MKQIIISLLGLAALALPACTTVEQRDPSTHTTTTSEVAPTIYGSTETTTTRTY